MKNNNRQSGFTLVEMAIVMAIVGLLVGGALSIYRPFDRVSRVKETMEKQEKIARAISGFALKNYRIPCPSDFHDKPNVGKEADCSSFSSSLHSGIIPYIALGIPESWAIDGWGRYMSYTVKWEYAYISPSFSDTYVHSDCRSAAWISAGQNINKPKARFCCAGAGFYYSTPDITVSSDYSDWEGSLIAPTRTPLSDWMNQYKHENTPAAVTDHLSQGMAYIMISHGEDGTGGYMPNAGAGIMKFQGNINDTGDAEKENAEYTQTNFYDLPLNLTPGANHFDDVILWRTPELIMSEMGASTCAVP